MDKLSTFLSYLQKIPETVTPTLIMFSVMVFIVLNGIGIGIGIAFRDIPKHLSAIISTILNTIERLFIYMLKFILILLKYPTIDFLETPPPDNSELDEVTMPQELHCSPNSDIDQDFMH